MDAEGRSVAKLVVMAPDGTQTDHVLRAINTLGRHPDQNVQILDRVVSKEHALITYADGCYWLQDMGSRNGSFVNGIRIKGRTKLNEGDAVTLGSTRVLYVEEPRETVPHEFSQVTINPAVVTETAIRSRVQTAGGDGADFLSESQIADISSLRSDYEKLRIAFQLNQAIATELDLPTLLERILDKAFDVTSADRGVILFMNESGVPEPRAVKHRDPNAGDAQFNLSSTILNEVITQHHAILSSDAMMDSRFDGSHSIMMQGIRSTVCVPLMFGKELLGMIHLDTKIATGVFTEKDLQVLSVFANQAAMKIANVRLAKRAEAAAVARNNLSRLLSPNLVDAVVTGKIAVEKGGTMRDATVMFSDIRGFTAMSERVPAQKMVSLLNEYFEIMVDIIFQHDGTLDKFVGDEIMAVWGAPVHQDDHAVKAVRAAMDMRKALDDLNRFRAANGEEIINVGWGINCGRLVAGYMGSTRTMSYTVVGDTVNLASRLCGVATAGQVIVTTPMLSQLGGEFRAVPLRDANLKGKSLPVPIYEVRVPEVTSS